MPFLFMRQHRDLPLFTRRIRMKKHHIVFLDADSIGKDITWPDFSEFGDVTFYESTSKTETMNRIKDATIVLTNKTVIREEMIEECPSLAYIGTLSTGYNQVKINAAKAKGIPVCNIPEYSTPAVAQHTLALILALAGDICGHNESVHQGKWSKSEQFCFWNKPVFELKEKTLGIIGFGSIGHAVGSLANAFGMNVLAYAPREKPLPEYTPFAFTSFDTIFTESDIVSLHCPLNAKSKGIVDSKRLSSMKPTALLINCSRGPLVVSQDLAQALKEGVIAGAGLDVIEVEPMRENDPLLSAPNCIITPHMAWATTEARTRLLQIAHANIRAFLDGHPVNVCNDTI